MKTNYMQKIISILLVVASMSTSVGACRMTTTADAGSDASVAMTVDSTVLTDASVDVDANMAPLAEPEPIVITVPGSP